MIQECSLSTRQVSPCSTPGCEKLALPHKLPEEEGNLLNCFFDDGFLQRLTTQGASNAVSRDAVAHMLAHVSFENAEISAKVLEFAMRQCTRSGPDEVTACLKAVRAVLLLPDEFQKKRIDMFLPLLTELVTRWLPSSYIACNYVADTFIELLFRCPQILAALKTPGSRLTAVREWLSDHDYPNNESRVLFHSSSW